MYSAGYACRMHMAVHVRRNRAAFGGRLAVLSLCPVFGMTDVKHSGRMSRRMGSSGGREAEELALLQPVARQLPGLRQQLSFGQVDRVLAFQKSGDDVGRKPGQADA